MAIRVRTQVDTRPLRELSAQLDNVASGVRTFSAVSKEQERVWRDAAASIKTAAASLRQYERNVSKTNLLMKKQVKTTKELALAQTNLGSAVRGAAGGFGKLWLTYGKIGPMLAGFAAAAGVKKLISSVYSAGEAFDYLTTYTRSIQDQSQSLAEYQNSLLKIKNVAHTPEELASGMKVLAKAGFSVQESLKAIPDLARFATVAEMDLGQAAELAVTQMRAFSRDGMSMTQMLNYMAAAALKSPQSFHDLQLSLTYLTEASLTAHQSFLDITTAIAMMAESGIKGSKAGTSLRQAIFRLLNPTDKVTAKLNSMLKSLNVITSSGKVKDFESLFRGLGKALKEFPAADRIRILYDLFSFRGMKAGVKMLDSIMSGSFANFKKQVAEAAEGVTLIDRVFKDLSETTRVQLKEISAEIQRGLIDAFDKETVTSIFSRIRDIVTDDSFKTSIKFMSDIFFGMAELTFEGIAKLADSLSVFTEVGQSDKNFLWFGEKAGDNTGVLQQQIDGIERIIASKSKMLDFYQSIDDAANKDRFIPAMLTNWAVTSTRQALEKDLDGLYRQLADSKKRLAALTRSDAADFKEEANAIAKTTVSVQDYSAARDNLNKLLGKYKTLNAVQSMSETEKVQRELNKQFREAKEALDASGLSGEAYRNKLEEIKNEIIYGAVAQAKLAKAKDADSKATKAQIDAISRVDKKIRELNATVASGGMSDEHKIIAKNTEAFNKYLAGLDKGVLGTKAYREAVQRLAKAYAEKTRRELDALNAKNALIQAQHEQALQDKIEERNAKIKKQQLTGIATLYAEVNYELAKFKGTDDYKALMKGGAESQAIANKKLKEFNELLVQSVFTYDNVKSAIQSAHSKLISYAKDSQSFTQGWSAGLVDIADNFETLGSIGFETAKDIHDALGDSLIDGIKNGWDGLGDIWQGVLDNLLERAVNWTVDVVWAIGDNLIQSMSSGQGFGAVGNMFSSLLSGNFSGAFDSLTGLMSGLNRPTGAVSSPFYVIPLTGGGLGGEIASQLAGALGLGGVSDAVESGIGAAAGWLGIGGQATIAPYVSGAGVALGAGGAGVALGAGGAAAGAGGAIGGMASFGLPQAGSIAAGASAAGAGGAGASAGMGAAAAGLGTALAFAAAPIAINLIGSLFDKEHPSWTIPTSAGRDLKVTKVTEDPLVDVHKALERTALFAGDAALKLKQYNSSLNDSEYASEYAEEAQRNFAAQLDSTWAYIEYLGNDVGEAWAAAALKIDGSIGSIDSFVDAAAGFDVAVDTSASMWDLATSAANGNAEALGALEQQFKSLGLGASAADEATMAMVGAVNQLSKTKLDLNAKATLDVEVRGDAHATASVTGASNVSSQFWWARGGEDSGWGPNITSGGILGHATGGVFEQPALIGRHLFGEAGPEILAPLPGGSGAFAEMAEGIKKLVAGQNRGEIVVHLHNYVAGKRVEDVIIPVVDRHVADREARGVTGRVAYAVG